MSDYEAKINSLFFEMFSSVNFWNFKKKIQITSIS